MVTIPGLQFDLGEDVAMLRDALQQFTAKEIAPRAGKIDRSDQFPMDLWRKFGELGVLGMTVSEEYGGTNMGYLAHIVAMEEISRRIGNSKHARAGPAAPPAPEVSRSGPTRHGTG